MPTIKMQLTWIATFFCYTQINAQAITFPTSSFAVDEGLSQTSVYSPDPITAESAWTKPFQLERLWERATGKGVNLAVCESGFLLGEADLDANLFLDRALDTINNNQTIDDSKFADLGTAVLSIIASTQNGFGMSGIAFDSKILPLQFYHFKADLDQNLSMPEASVRCILQAIKNKDISILLLQSTTFRGSAEADDIVRAAITQATNSGIIVVLPAGDSSKELITEKISQTKSILVGAALTEGSQALFSNYGSRVNVAAYGETVKAYFGRGRYESLVGTIAASAQIAGLTALMKEVNPCLLPEDAASIFLQTNSVSEKNIRIGGLVNPVAALEKARMLPCQEKKLDLAVQYRRKLIEKLNK
jgi:hypothetical protein